MKKFLKFYLYTLLLVTLASSCQEQEVSFLPNGEAEFPTGERVEASFYGRLLNQDLEPVIDGEVWIEDRMAVSDSLGDWIIPSVEVTSRQAYVKVKADGYFPASRVLSALPNSMNLVRIMPTAKRAYESIQSGDGGVVALPDGSSLTFQAGSFVDELTGASYNGEVRVFAHSIDGRSESSQVQMPGRLESTTEEAALISFGMIVAELETPDGMSLQLKEGFPATIRYEQAQLDPNAPETIPLWHFDEGIGTWVKEGVSVREGNAYVGEVAHFTWWNCDVPASFIDFCIQFQCGESNSLVSDNTSNDSRYYVRVKVTPPNSSPVFFGGPLAADLKLCEVIPNFSSIEFEFLLKDGSRYTVGPLVAENIDIDFGLYTIPCDDLDEYLGNRFAAIGPVPPTMTCSLNWTYSTCEGVDQDFLIRITSTEFNSIPLIFAASKTQFITATVPQGVPFSFDMLSSSTGELIGRKHLLPRESIDVGDLNPETGIINATGYEVKGKLIGCNGPLDDVNVKLYAEDGSLIDESMSSSVGRFVLNTDMCDARYVSINIRSADGNKTFTSNLYRDLDLGEIMLCPNNGEFYFKGEVNGQTFEYDVCNGRAGVSGWVAYADREPDPNAPFFGLVHSNKIPSAGTYRVGWNMPIQFNGFRMGQHVFTRSSHPFEGELVVSEYGQVAAGVFTGSCADENGETVSLEIEMRFVKP